MYGNNLYGGEGGWIEIPEGKVDIRNEIRHGVMLHDTKNQNHYGFNYNLRSQTGIVIDGFKQQGKIEFREMKNEL